MNKDGLLRDLVGALLSAPLNAPGEWSLQGFGMLRYYMTPDRALRLHVWHSGYSVPGVSVVHTHPWAFDSYVVSGLVRNVRYQEEPPDAPYPHGVPYQKQQIRCGPGGGLTDDPSTAVQLYLSADEYCAAGTWYSQKPEEIHASYPDDGTVTLVRRTFGTDTEHAYVYWPAGEEWVSAEPRKATPDEILAITECAYKRWWADERWAKEQWAKERSG